MQIGLLAFYKFNLPLDGKKGYFHETFEEFVS